MKNIVIVGAGEFARELVCWIEDVASREEIQITGFIDDNVDEISRLSDKYPYPVLGRVTDYVPRPDDFFILAIGNPTIKLRIASELESRGGAFFNLIHPTAVVARTAKIGRGVILCPFSLVSADCEVGDFVTINAYSSVGHDVIIGPASTVSSHVDLTGGVLIGAGVFIGSNASILPKVKVGSSARVGAGAIVVRNVAADTTVYALPAKTL